VLTAERLMLQGLPSAAMWVREWVKDEGHCVPSVAVLVTDEVERICLKNGLLFHELLR
jgi:hypothetical protein